MELGNSGSNFTPTTVSKLLIENKEGKECHNPLSFVDFSPENDEKDIYSHNFYCTLSIHIIHFTFKCMRTSSVNYECYVYDMHINE